MKNLDKIILDLQGESKKQTKRPTTTQKEFKIEKNIPAPDRYPNGKQVRIALPIYKMEVGESFLMNCDTQ